jgi:membrane protein implicated in regulation of membrane protease activity
MIDWWNGLELAQQIFALVGIGSTVILVIQMAMMLFGLGDDSDADVDDIDDVGDGDGLALFTVKGIIAMLSITGWTGVIFLGTEMPTALSYVLASLCGFATLIIMAYVMRAISGLQSSGNIEIGNAVGKVGQVYIPIKPNCAGKVNITVQGQYSEFTAISTSSETLSTGSYVRVVAVDEAGTLVVEPIAVDGKKSL